MVEIVKGSPNHASAKIAELIWSVDVPLVNYLFQGRRNWDRMAAVEWPESVGLVCYSESLLAIDGDKIVGILVAHDPATMDYLFEKSLDRWKREASDPLAKHLDVAFAWMDRLFPHPPSDSYYILELAVDPAVHRQGIGRKLMMVAIERGRALGRRSLQLDVNGETEAVQFYKALGMEIEVETRVPYLAETHGIGTHYHMGMPLDPSSRA
jgi:ribosomal protein S18 acetylase RimI-like enzyme